MANRVDEDGKVLKTRRLTAQIIWEHKMRNMLIKIAKEHGLKIENPNEYRLHLDTPAYIEQKSENLRELDMDQIEELYFELSDLEGERGNLKKKKRSPTGKR